MEIEPSSSSALTSDASASYGTSFSSLVLPGPLHVDARWSGWNPESSSPASFAAPTPLTFVSPPSDPHPADPPPSPLRPPSALGAAAYARAQSPFAESPYAPTISPYSTSHSLNFDGPPSETSPHPNYHHPYASSPPHSLNSTSSSSSHLPFEIENNSCLATLFSPCFSCCDASSSSSSFSSSSSSSTSPFLSWRFFHVLMCFIAGILAYMLRNDVSIAVIPIAAELHLSDSDQGLLLSAFYFGYICFQLLGGALASKFGAKWPLAFALVASSALSLVFPLSQSSFAGMVVLRVLTGMAQAFLYPSAYALIASWVPPADLCKATAFFSTGGYVGTILADVVAPLLSACCGWPEIFYVFGMLSFIWLTPWTLFVASSPAAHPFVSRAELMLIDPALCDLDLSLDSYTIAPERDNLFEAALDGDSTMDWRALLASPALWGLVCVSFAYGWVNYVIMSFLPKFFNNVYGLSTTLSGWITAGCYVLLTASALLTAALADHIKETRPKLAPYVKKAYACVGLLVPATIFPFLGMHGVPLGAAAGLALFSVCILGFGLNGWASNHMDLSQKYAGTIMGVTNMFGNVPGAVGVYLSGWILQETDGNWSVVFGLATCVAYIGTLVYVVFGSVKPIEGLELKSKKTRL